MIDVKTESFTYDHRANVWRPTKTKTPTLTRVLLALAAAGAAIGAMALAEPPKASAQPTTEVTVDGYDYPLCSVEDCSDQPNQIGVWFDADGSAWLSLGEVSYRIER